MPNTQFVICVHCPGKVLVGIYDRYRAGSLTLIHLGAVEIGAR